MDSEFCIEKQDFALVKEKIIKINEVLQVCNEKDEKYAKATHAFKQLKAKYEAAMHETNRLKMDNEHLSYSLEIIKPKYEQSEKDLIELQSDYSKVNDRYEKNMIESQLAITELEEKIKHCVCQNELILSPSKKRNSKDQGTKELKEVLKELKEVENNLKNENSTLLLKNKEIQEQNLRSLKIIKEISSKNAVLQNDLATLKDKMQKMELISKDQKNLHLHITSLKNNHEKEIHSLKMELSKLSSENQKIKYLELECTKLKKQINCDKKNICEKKDGFVQTEKCSENNSLVFENVERISALELECEKLKKKLKEFETGAVTKMDFSIQTDVIELGQISKSCDENTSDFEDSIQDIWKEMILPRALSPFSFSSTESPAHSIEPVPSLEEELDQETSSDKFIPSIIITPPTPYIDKINTSGTMFPLVTTSPEEKLQKKKVVLSESANVESDSIKQDITSPIKQIAKIETLEIVKSHLEESLNIEQEDIGSAEGNRDKQYHSLPKNQKNISLREDPESAIKKPETSVNQYERAEDCPVLEKIESPRFSGETKETSLEKQQLPPEIISSSSLNTSPIFTCEKSVNTESDLFIDSRYTSGTSKSSEVRSLDGAEHLRDKIQNRRKFLMPYSMNTFVKYRRRQMAIKKYKQKSLNQTAQNDTILSALRTLQQNKINFTISNESIPLIQPYSCYSVVSTPKVEPRIISERHKDTFCYTTNCWSKKCIANNTQMLLRTVQNQEEPDLLGFFSVKDEVITPSASRMAVPEKPRPAATQEVVEQLLNGIKKLVDIKTKETLRSRKKRRTKSRSRRSDFYSETETELENLFRKSADVLERNRKFLAAAKNQNWNSSEGSVLQSEPDLMLDSGLVSGTPKIDTDSLGFFSQNETNNVIKPDTESSIIKAESCNNDHAILQKNDIGFSSPSSKITGNCSTPNYSVCPDMLSPIASSKGSPEALQVASTSLQTPKSNTNLESSPDIFRTPFCPIMLSPMTSSEQKQEREILPRVSPNFQSVSRVDMNSVNEIPSSDKNFLKTSIEFQNILKIFPKESTGEKTTGSFSSDNNRQVESVLASNQKVSETDIFGDISNSEEDSCAKVNKEVVENKAKKINIVGDILISKGHTVNLLSKDGKCTQKHDVASDLRDTDIMRSPSPTRKIENTTETSRKTLILEQKIPICASTPVLSQEIQGTIKTGPEGQTINPSQVSDVCGQEKKQNCNNHTNDFKLTEQTVIQHLVTQSCDKEEIVLKGNSEQNGTKAEEFDCPKSPDVKDEPDCLPKLVSTEKPVKLPPKNEEDAEENNSLALGCTPISLYKNSLLDHDYTNPSEKRMNISKNDTTLSVSNMLGNKEDAEENKPVQVTEENSDANSIGYDLSIESSDLNCTLDDIHISQLDLSPEINNEQNKSSEVNRSPDSSNLDCDDLNNPKCQVILQTTEKRYSLRDRASSKKRTNSPEFILPKPRASKRKLCKKPDIPDDPSGTSILNYSDNPVEHIKRKRGRPAKDRNSIGASNQEKLKNTEPITLLPHTTLETIEQSNHGNKDSNKKDHHNVEENVSSNNDVQNINRDKIDDNVEMKDIEADPRKIPYQRIKSINAYPDDSILKVESDSEKKNDKAEIESYKINYLLNDRQNIIHCRQNIVKSKEYISKEFISESDTESEASHKMYEFEIDASTNSDIQNKKSDKTNNAIDVEEIKKEARTVTHRQKSRNTNPDVNVPESKPRTERNSHKKSEETGREESESYMISTNLNNNNHNLVNDMRKKLKSKLYISKEYVSESESECETSKKKLMKTHDGFKVGLTHDIDAKKNNNYCVNNEQEKGILPNFQSISGIDMNSSNTVSGSNKNHLTCEIQNILRMFPEESGGERTTISLGVDNNYKQAESRIASHRKVSETDLFGDISDIDEGPCSDTNQNVVVTQKPKPTKVLMKKGNTLRKKIMSQVKGMVYASGAGRGYNSTTKNQNDSFVAAPKNIVTKNNVPVVQNRVNKINIVENTLISKGHTINLLSKDGRCVQTHDIASDLRDTGIRRSPSPTMKRERATKTYSRKRLRLEQKICNGASTPVDILSQVMQGMVKTGPKAQARKNPSQVSNVFDHEKKRNYNTHIDAKLTEQKVMQHIVTQSGDKEKMVLDANSEQNGTKTEEFYDCPKSPDVIEVPDRLPRLIPTTKPVKLPPSKVQVLIDKLMVFSNEAIMLDEVINEFAFQDMRYIIEIILTKLSLDYHDKANNLFPPSPPMTSTQRVLLGFLLRLDNSTHPGIREKFLSLAELKLFNRYSCTLEIVQPFTRLITALYKLKYDLNRIRRFICEGFYFMGDFAVPMFFTLLTMWPEALPMESETSEKMLAKVIVQICFLKECNQPGYNLLPLRDLLNKFYGYPVERWNCEDIFRDILVEYIRNPSIRSSDFTLLLFLKNKPTKWVHQKIKNHIIPLFQKASDSNPNLKATLVILLANICCGFQKSEKYDWSVILEMDNWFLELDINDLHPILKRSIWLARNRLPKRANVKKKNKINENIDIGNKSNSPDNCERTQPALENLAQDLSDNIKKINSEDVTINPNDKSKQDLNENSNITQFEVVTYASDNESMEDFSANSNTVNIELSGWSSDDGNCERTNQIVNLNVKLDSDQTVRVCQDSVFSSSDDKESDCLNSSLSDIEF